MLLTKTIFLKIRRIEIYIKLANEFIVKQVANPEKPTIKIGYILSSWC